MSEDTTYPIRKKDGSKIDPEDWVNLKNELLDLPRNPLLTIARANDDKTVLIDIGYSASLFYIGLLEGKLKKMGYSILNWSDYVNTSVI